MIQIAPQMRLLVAVEPADFRRGIDGLVCVCREALSADPFLCGGVRNVAPAPIQASRTTGSRMFRAVAVRWPATFSAGVFENPEDVVCRLIEVTAVPGHVRVLEALAHHLDVGFRVAMRCGDLRVSEPCLDRDEVCTCAQQLHRQSMPKQVG